MAYRNGLHDPPTMDPIFTGDPTGTPMPPGYTYPVLFPYGDPTPPPPGSGLLPIRPGPTPPTPAQAYPQFFGSAGASGSMVPLLLFGGVALLLLMKKR